MLHCISKPTQNNIPIITDTRVTPQAAEMYASAYTTEESPYTPSSTQRKHTKGKENQDLDMTA